MLSGLDPIQYKLAAARLIDRNAEMSNGELVGPNQGARVAFCGHFIRIDNHPQVLALKGGERTEISCGAKLEGKDPCPKSFAVTRIGKKEEKPSLGEIGNPIDPEEMDNKSLIAKVCGVGVKGLAWARECKEEIGWTCLALGSTYTAYWLATQDGRK